MSTADFVAGSSEREFFWRRSSDKVEIFENASGSLVNLFPEALKTFNWTKRSATAFGISVISFSSISRCLNWLAPTEPGTGPSIFVKQQCRATNSRREGTPPQMSQAGTEPSLLRLTFKVIRDAKRVKSSGIFVMRFPVMLSSSSAGRGIEQRHFGNDENLLWDISMAIAVSNSRGNDSGNSDNPFADSFLLCGFSFLVFQLSFEKKKSGKNNI